MNNDYIKDQLIRILSKEFQTVFLIKLDDLSMEVFSTDIQKAIPNGVETAKKLNSYNEAREWYIENCVVERSRKRVREQTSIEYVLSQLADGESFFIEYSRLMDGNINFNQICYDKICDPDNGKIEYITQGFRSIDISKKAEIDNLTGLLIRPAFFRQAEELLHNNPGVTYDLVLSDIVDFKKINETYGVKVADEILRWQGDFLTSIKSNKFLFGRYGGDQVVIFGPHESIAKLISKENLESFFESEKENGLPSISIKFGVYLNVDAGKSILSTCDKAHIALNSIKHHYDKQIAYYNEDMKNFIDRQHRIENSMHKSLRDGDFKVFYQPKHDAKSGELVGAEALVRWIHPEYGFMNPGEFIPLFEQNGFIAENDRFVFRRTCENIRRWSDKGINTVPISVNASKLTMADTDVVNNMKEAISANNLSADKLHIEITETLMTDNVDELIDKLNAIRETGFEVELDDFGAGFSSINVLSILPIDILKLDMSFMRQFGDKKRAIVLQSCIELAKKLGFKTVSEGVEYQDQCEELGRLGVDMIQGYYYSKPLPEDDFEKYLIEHRCG